MPDILEVPSRSVLVGVDGSVESLAALGYAATEAHLRQAPLAVVHAWAGPQWRPGRCGGEPVARIDAERLLATATAWLRLHHPHLAVTGRLVLGEPVQVLTAGSRTAQLVVVGHRGTGLHLLGWGSVAAQLSRRTRAPLVVRVFRPQASEPPLSAPLVVAVSPNSSGRTLRFAFEEAALRGVPLAPCYVWSPANEPGEWRRGTRGYAAARAAAARVLAEALAGWATRYPTVEVRPEVRHGVDVARTLVTAARNARLLVVGAGPDSALVEILRGSVSMGVLRIADCPVAVVPEPVAATAPEPASAERPEARLTATVGAEMAFALPGRPIPGSLEPDDCGPAIVEAVTFDSAMFEPAGAGPRTGAGPVGTRPRT